MIPGFLRIVCRLLEGHEGGLKLEIVYRYAHGSVIIPQGRYEDMHMEWHHFFLISM